MYAMNGKKIEIYTVESHHSGYNDWYELEWTGFNLEAAKEYEKKMFTYKNRICRWDEGQIVESWVYENGNTIE